jgi:hypothetical protein
LCLWVWALPGRDPRSDGLNPAEQTLLSHISADSLRGQLSFIASDLLEGRDTPSRGLDLAAEYIAAQFRRAGLEPAGDKGYFQTAEWPVASPDQAGFKFELKSGESTVTVSPARARWSTEIELAFTVLPLIRIDYQAADSLGENSMTGKVLITEPPDLDRLAGADRMAAFRAWANFIGKARSANPACLVSIGRTAPGGPPRPRLLGRQNAVRPTAGPLRPVLTGYDAQLIGIYDSRKSGEELGALSLHVAPDQRTTVPLWNVVGLLRGSDPSLSDSYILVTAHYDHLGMKDTGSGDRIFNGANDDGSGTVSVVELASAFASMNPRPKRSIAFITFFGEEKGLLGSRYYGEHPIFPVSKTIADINLEQVGRTDDDEGPQIGTATMTGLDYSDIGPIFQAAGEALGIKVYKHPRNSDGYFSRSDNQSLADQGVPAHTLCVAFSYPDYHGVGDEWEKIDYRNMEKIDRLVALGIYRIAQDSIAPRWNASNPKATKYLEAWKKNHPE